VRSAVAVACFCLAFASGSQAWAQDFEINCTNGESDEPSGFVLRFDGNGHGTATNRYLQADHTFEYSEVGPYLVMFEDNWSRVLRPDTGKLGYVNGDARSWSEDKLAQDAQPSYGQECTVEQAAAAEAERVAALFREAQPSTGRKPTILDGGE